MSTPSAAINGKQRRNALLRATGLVLLMMLFSGYTVSLFPVAEEMQTLNKREFVGKDLAKLKALKKSYEALGDWLNKVSALYSDIIAKDNLWVKTSPESQERAALQEDIMGLERSMSALVDDLSKTSADTVLKPALVRVVKETLAARRMVWVLRSPQTPLMPGGQAEDCQRKAAAIAEALNMKIWALQQELNNVGRKAEKGEKHNFQTYIDDLKIDINQLRGL